MANRKIKEIIIHHSASARETTTVSQIKRWHLDRGWDHIGYHYVIHPNGATSQVLTPKREGYGVYGKNTHSIHICVIGNYETELLSTGALGALQTLLAKLCRKYNLYSWNVLGHKTAAMPSHPTACPGKYLIEKLPEIKQWLMKELREDAKPKESTTHVEIERSFTWWEWIKHWFEKVKLFFKERGHKFERWHH